MLADRLVPASGTDRNPCPATDGPDSPQTPAESAGLVRRLDLYRPAGRRQQQTETTPATGVWIPRPPTLRTPNPLTPYHSQNTRRINTAPTYRMSPENLFQVSISVGQSQEPPDRRHALSSTRTEADRAHTSQTLAACRSAATGSSQVGMNSCATKPL